jgi:membrane protein
MTPLRQLLTLSKAAIDAWIDDYAPSMAAAISYYTVFSLAPLLVIVIAVAGAIFGEQAARGQISQQIAGVMGPEGAQVIEGLVSAAANPGRGLAAGLGSIVLVLVGATTVFAELQAALDRIWHVPMKQRPSGIWGILRARVLSFGLILGLAFLLVASLVVSAGLAALGGWAGGLMPGWEVLLHLLNAAVSLSVFTVLFAMIYKLLPSARIAWGDVWVGAFVTAVLFDAGKFLIALYIGKSGFSETFAAAGAVVLLLAWVYYAACIFLIGAEFTKVYSDARGSGVAARVDGQARREQQRELQASGSATADDPLDG